MVIHSVIKAEWTLGKVKINVKKIIGLVAMLFVLFSAQVEAAKLSVGDPAPKLNVKQFVKGQPVSKFEKGKIYVVEFWATWCGPCIQTIPHVTKLQKMYKNVTFIGVSVWESDQSKVVPFVKNMGPKMDYRVAMDSVPAGQEGSKGFMSVNWMQAAGQNGIPAAFIVDKETRVAWIGHPAQMDEPLEQIVAGKFDISKAKAKAEIRNKTEAKLRAIAPELNKAIQAKDHARVVSLVNAAIAETPALEEQLAMLKFVTLRELGKDDEAARYGSKLADGIIKDNAMSLNQLAWLVVDPDAKKKPTAELVKAALKAALRADELTKGKEAAIADTLAKAYYDNGQVDKAVSTQERAVRLSKGTEFEQDKSIADRLEMYKKAAK